MKYNIHDILEYIVALVSDFADKFGMTEKNAYNYILKYGGVDFIETNYGILHTLDFKEVVDSVALYCRRMGGEL